MIRKHLKILIITSIVTQIPILGLLVLWNHLPEQLPFHWNLSGEVDEYAPKGVVILMPLILTALQWLCAVVTSADPKRANIPDKVMHLVLWIIPILSLILTAVILATALGSEIMMDRLSPILIGLGLTVIGNYMPKCKQSYTMGIKLPWTLNSEENWNKTHRLAGWLWTVGGILLTLSGFLGLTYAALPLSLILVLIPTVYSFLLYKKGI